jgi:hypothetical protein
LKKSTDKEIVRHLLISSAYFSLDKQNTMLRKFSKHQKQEKRSLSLIIGIGSLTSNVTFSEFHYFCIDNSN